MIRKYLPYCPPPRRRGGGRPRWANRRTKSAILAVMAEMAEDGPGEDRTVERRIRKRDAERLLRALAACAKRLSK